MCIVYYRYCVSPRFVSSRGERDDGRGDARSGARGVEARHSSLYYSITDRCRIARQIVDRIGRRLSNVPPHNYLLELLIPLYLLNCRERTNEKRAAVFSFLQIAAAARARHRRSVEISRSGHTWSHFASVERVTIFISSATSFISPCVQSSSLFASVRLSNGWQFCSLLLFHSARIRVSCLFRMGFTQLVSVNFSDFVSKKKLTYSREVM